jgi:transposase
LNRLENAIGPKRDPYQIELPKLIRRQRHQRLKQLQKEIAQLDAQIDSLITSDERLRTQSQLLCSIPAIAKLTAAKLLSELAGKEFHRLGSWGPMPD